MRKFAFALCFAAVALSLAANAQTPPPPTTPQVVTNYNAFQVTKGLPTTGPMLAVPPGGLYCAVMMNYPFAYTFITPQGSDDTYIWHALPTIGNGTITMPGFYIGLNPYHFFRPYFTQSTSPGATGYEACGDNPVSLIAPMLNGENGVLNTYQQLTAIGHAGCAAFDANGFLISSATPCPNGGGSLTLAPGVCTSPFATTSPTNGAGLNYTCATPTTAPVIAATATACGAPVTGGLFSVSVPVCPSPYPTPTFNIIVIASPCATPTASGSTFFYCTNQFEKALLARTDVQHVWGFHDLPNGCGAAPCTPGPCSTSAGAISDLISLGATALPSPVPLTISTGDPAARLPVCGTAPILPGAGTSIMFCNQNAAPSNFGCVGGSGQGATILIPQPLFLTPPYTYGCIFDGRPLANTAATSTIMSVGSNAEELVDTTAGSYGLLINNVSFSGTMTGANVKGMMTLTDDGTTNVLYLNGSPVTSPTFQPSPAATSGAFGGRPPTHGAAGFNGPMQDCWFANTVWPPSTMEYFWILTGL